MKSLHDLFFRFPREFPLPFILDGATGTALMKRGMPSGSCLESWVGENPGVIREVQDSYRRAGSDAVYTPTFGANTPTLARHGITGDTSALNGRLAALSIRPGALTGGDMSPTGLFAEPFGDTPFERLVDIYAEQAEALEHAGVDFFALETMINLDEVRAAVLGIKRASSKPVFVSLTVDARGRTMSGDALDCAFAALADLGVSAFGCNCSVGPDAMLEVIKPLTPLALAYGIPLIAKPNAGMPHEDADGCQHFDLSADEFASYAPRFLDAGALLLGGCCGSDDSFIAALRRAVDLHTPDITAEPARADDIACTSRELVHVGETTDIIDVCEDFADDIDGDEDYLCLRVADAEAAEYFLAEAFALTSPVAMTGDPAAVALCRRRYNGRIFVF